MNDRLQVFGRTLRGGVTATLLFLLIQLGALTLVRPFDAAGYRAVENPSDPTNSGLYLIAILVVTGGMLFAFRYDFDRVVRAAVVLAAASLAWHVFSVVVPRSVPARSVVTLALAAGLAGALLVRPEWYVIDAVGVVIGAGGAGLFGISFGLLPATVLLVVLAVYDAISVYGTEHMLDLAEGVMALRLPVVLAVPLVSGYSLLDERFDDGAEPSDARDSNANDDLADRDVVFVGLGDAVIPTVLVASAAVFSPAPALGVVVLPSLNLPAVGALLGTNLGLAILLWAVFRGRAHAGLPLLNGGAIAGYLLGSVAAGVTAVDALGLTPYV